MTLKTFETDLKVIIVGSSGGIGGALVNTLVEMPQVGQLYSLSRKGQRHPSTKVSNLLFDFMDEASLTAAAETLKTNGPFDIIIVATGLLQGDGAGPEKNMRALSHQGFAKSFEINTIGPAMTAKHLIPLLRRDRKAVFAALSARVGSISDNRLGGWYAYRASKAALNMVLKTLSIEVGRRFKDQIIIGLHPGTVDTDLSKPFQGNVPDGKLFSPDYSAKKLLEVIDQRTSEDSGSLFDWAGKRVEF